MDPIQNTSRCTLCGSVDTEPFFEDKTRTYLQCGDCRLVFVPRRFWLSLHEEKAIYDLHQNEPEDEGYRRFLSRLALPLMERLKPNSEGLDFGCGPGPALPLLFEEQGHRVSRYDPLYHNNPSVFDRQYDFICATEVVEHLRDPNREFARLFAMLKKGGWLGLMTKLVIDKNAFSRWHYIRDLTHILFFSRSTFERLATRFNTRLKIIGNDTILFRIPD